MNYPDARNHRQVLYQYQSPHEINLLKTNPMLVFSFQKKFSKKFQTRLDYCFWLLFLSQTWKTDRPSSNRSRKEL